METLATLFLYSSQKYSSLADEIFGDSVEKSQFASTISNQRMQVAKNITGTPLDIQVDMDDEDMDVLSRDSDWQSCLALDNILMQIMANEEAKFLPLLTGVYTAAHRGAAYASQVDNHPKYKQCLSCGAVSETWECPICGNGRNWLTGVEVPENSETPETIVDATEEEVSLPNLSFADFPPERPAQPQKWEVLLDGQEDDIFKATGLARPTLG